jgi:hypothetical protein
MDETAAERAAASHRLWSSRVAARRVGIMTRKPRPRPTDEALLGELYDRFVKGTRDWVQTYYRAAGPARTPGTDLRSPESLDGGLARKKGEQAAFIRELLTTCCTFAETLWLPDEIERRKDSLRNRRLTPRAERLTTVEPDLALARFLFDHQDRLPSFFSQDQHDLDATPFDVLVWFHFQLYPNLKQKFLAGDFPAVQDLPAPTRRLRPSPGSTGTRHS